jgi:hypothetical protein
MKHIKKFENHSLKDNVIIKESLSQKDATVQTLKKFTDEVERGNGESNIRRKLLPLIVQNGSFDLLRDILKFELQQADIDLLSDPSYFKEMSGDITEDEANERAEGFRNLFDNLPL